MAGSKLVDLELDDEDKMDTLMPIAMPSKPDYPYGLRICLCEKELTKLGLPVPDIGDMIDARIFGRVTSVSSESREGGDTCRVEIQIEYMSAENEMTEEE